MAYTAEQQAIADEASRRAQANGTTPQMEVWKYAQSQGIDAAGIDSYMGYAPGTSQSWAVKNGQAPAAQGNNSAASINGGSTNLGMSKPTYNQDQQSIIDEATRRSKSNGTSSEQELWNYASGKGMKPGEIDSYMGWKPGASSDWAKTNVPNYSAPTQQPTGGGQNLGMGGYNPQQNPYLGQMGRDIGNQMFDNWSRNTMPSIRSGAMAAGGFGGSRQGVVEANGMNDMNRQYGQALTSMYGQDWSNQQNRNLQAQSTANQYDLGLRSSDLGFANLDANINNSNASNQLNAANFGLNAYNTMNGQTQAGIQAGTNIQNTPLDYQKYFTNSANGSGAGFGTSTSSQTNQGNPWMGAAGGAMMGNSLQYPK